MIGLYMALPTPVVDFTQCIKKCNSRCF